MTVTGIFALAIICSATIGGAILLIVSAEHTKRTKAIIVAVAVLICIVAVFAVHWYYTSTASGQRAVKTQQSNFDKGVERTVKVYDVNGGLIQSYEGKFDVDYDDNRIIFDDEKGKRHIIYYPTGTVIIDEK